MLIKSKVDKLSAFAKLLGAGPNSAGTMGKTTSEQMNGWLLKTLPSDKG
jgi:hypothetical protein